MSALNNCFYNIMRPTHRTLHTEPLLATLASTIWLCLDFMTIPVSSFLHFRPINGTQQWFSNLNKHQKHLEGILKDKLLGPTFQSICFSRFGVDSVLGTSLWELLNTEYVMVNKGSEIKKTWDFLTNCLTTGKF